MSDTHVITGVTGFVGGALALELLARTDLELLCIVRSSGEDQPQERVFAALREAAEAYNRLDLLNDAEARCVPVEGDLTRPLAGVNPDAVRGAVACWHCAASLQFEDEHKDAIWQTNVDGTAGMLDLAKRAAIPVFHYVSTAYVAGDRSGDILEEAAPPDVTVNNWYEQSKIAAEQLVAAAGMPRWTVMRPSIVIGHSVTRRATSFSGMYGLVRGLHRFNTRVRSELGDFLKHRPIRFLVEPECAANLIPIDTVANALAAIGLDDKSSAHYFHVANVAPPRVDAMLALACQELGLSAPSYTHAEDELTSMDQRLHEELRFYRSYANNSKRFDTTNTEAIVGKRALTRPLPPDELGAYVHWYVELITERDRDGVERRVPVAQGEP